MRGRKITRLYGMIPAAAGILALGEYYYLPNYNNQAGTEVYPAFLKILLACVMLLGVLSFFIDPVWEYLREHVPWYTVIFLIFLIYDHITLKKGIFTLPMFPGPDKLMSEMVLDRGILLDCAKNSLFLLFRGYLLGIFTGLVCGLLAGQFSGVRYWIAPLLKVIGPIPAVTWMALIFVLAPSLAMGCVIMVAYSVWYPVTSGTMNGILRVDKAYYEAAQMLGARSSLQLIRRVTIPMILPDLFQGLVAGMRAACASLMIAEMMGVESGLAWYITWQRGWGNFTKMYTAVAAICITFLIVDFILNVIKRKVIRWK
ncbi:MAG: ABC transporter permease subunit [Lachnospiraceae bacterium]|nr:ABC transporter permease subunit [Lachnospiraceae bacterium]